MYLDAFYSLAIGFAGAILFVLVDKYEPDGPMTRLRFRGRAQLLPRP